MPPLEATLSHFFLSISVGAVIAFSLSSFASEPAARSKPSFFSLVPEKDWTIQTRGGACPDVTSIEIEPTFTKIIVKLGKGPLVITRDRETSQAARCSILAFLEHEKGWIFQVTRVVYPAKIHYELKHEEDEAHVVARVDLSGTHTVGTHWGKPLTSYKNATTGDFAYRTYVRATNTLVSGRGKRDETVQPREFDSDSLSLARSYRINNEFPPASLTRHKFFVKLQSWMNSPSEESQLTLLPEATPFNTDGEHTIHIYLRWLPVHK